VLNDEHTIGGLEALRADDWKDDSQHAPEQIIEQMTSYDDGGNYSSCFP
jgi:hypothetical protein